MDSTLLFNFLHGVLRINFFENFICSMYMYISRMKIIFQLLYDEPIRRREGKKWTN
jgi:hypothetical protein